MSIRKFLGGVIEMAALFTVFAGFAMIVDPRGNITVGLWVMGIALLALGWRWWR